MMAYTITGGLLTCQLSSRLPLSPSTRRESHKRLMLMKLAAHRVGLINPTENVLLGGR